MVDFYTATEVAFNNGKAEGIAKGYADGFADGLAAAGIAPIQWRDTRVLPFKPEPRTDYALIFKRQSDLALIWTSGMIFACGLNPEDVLFWCPVNIPDAPEPEADEKEAAK